MALLFLCGPLVTSNSCDRVARMASYSQATADTCLRPLSMAFISEAHMLAHTNFEVLVEEVVPPPLPALLWHTTNAIAHIGRGRGKRIAADECNHDSAGQTTAAEELSNSHRGIVCGMGVPSILLARCI